MRALLVLLFIAACASTEPQAPQRPLDINVPDTQFCAAAEQQLKHLDCRDPRGLPMWVNRDGETFTVTCENAQKNGDVFLNPRCIAAAKTCTETEQCPAQ